MEIRLIIRGKLHTSIKYNGSETSDSCDMTIDKKEAERLISELTKSIMKQEMKCTQ